MWKNISDTGVEIVRVRCLKLDLFIYSYSFEQLIQEWTHLYVVLSDANLPYCASQASFTHSNRVTV